MVERNIQKPVATIVTQSVVSKEDPAFGNPTKPIGAFILKKSWIKFLKAEKSPTLKIAEEDTDVLSLLKTDYNCRERCNWYFDKEIAGTVKCLFIEENGMLKGTDAVIDKDFASALLAAEINADYLFILTDVAINFGKPEQQNLLEMTVEEALRYMDEGQFPKGSMGPKNRSSNSILARKRRQKRHYYFNG